MSSENQGSAFRIPPHNDEAERGVLGSILLDPDTVLDKCVTKHLTADAFYDPRHKVLYQQLVEMSLARRPMDAITIADWLRDKGVLEKVGGYEYLIQLQDSTLVSAHAEHYADIVLDKYLARRLIEKSNAIIDECYKSPDNARVVLGHAEEAIYQLSVQREDNISSWDKSIDEVFKEIENTDPNDINRGVTTGYESLNKLLRGLHPTDMIVLAARPSMGKTSLAMNIAENAALGKLASNKGVPVGIFSLEMSREQLVRRILFSNARVSAQSIQQRRPTPQETIQLTGAVSRLKEAKIFIDDTPGLEAVELRSRARRMKSRFGIQLIVIDYLQLLNYEKYSREGRQRETMAISGAIKAMAKELEVPVLVLSQLSRNTESRTDNIPKLSDLRDSGAIEQDADVVLLLYRPSYYKTGEERDDDTLAIVDVAKHRNGPTGSVKMTFIKEYTRFEDREEHYDV